MQIGVHFADRDFQNPMRVAMKSLFALDYHCAGNLSKKNVAEFIRNVLFACEEFRSFGSWNVFPDPAVKAKAYFARIISEESVFFDKETEEFLISRDYDCNGSYFQIDTDTIEVLIEDY